MAFQFGGSADHQDHDDNGDLAEINMIPLVDVMLVLLIIFMVTAPLSIGGINVQLPFSKASSGQVEEKRVVLSINAQGEYFIETMKINDQQLEAKLRAIYQYREKKDLYIRADRAVPYGQVVKAMSAAKLAGVNKIAMLTQPPHKKG